MAPPLAWGTRRRLLLLLQLALRVREVRPDYFPFKGDRPLRPATGASASATGRVAMHSAEWQPPLMQPWEPLRATQASVTVAWTPAWNAWCDVAYYELQARRPSGPPLQLADLAALQFRETDREVDLDFAEHRAWSDAVWTPWQVAYNGRGRTFTMWVPPRTAPAVQFRVRACGRAKLDGCSDWSPVQTAHTVVSAAQDKVNFLIRGTGRNAHNYTEIVFNRITLFKRRDSTGLVLAVLSRLDLSLQWLRTYDTHRDRSEALQMSKDIRQFNQSVFIVVASAIAWEWHAPHSLVKTMEYCGAYHFGQWAHTFAEQAHYQSNLSDLQQDASQTEFGHPYAFIGIPGIGAGNGWESLMHNTGQYLPRAVKAQDAVIRGIAYYDYVFRIYRLQDVVATKAAFYSKNQPPDWETLHNPLPVSKRGSFDNTPQPLAAMIPTYVPYVGTMQSYITRIIEANETVPPYNFAFVLTTDAQVRKVDPRPRSYWLTEIERVWQGASARYWPHNGSLLNPGLTLEQRSCTDFIYNGFNFASPESCGVNFASCCSKIDAPGWLVTACGIGVSPTLCKDSVVIQLQNKTPLLTTKWPFPFRVISWDA